MWFSRPVGSGITARVVALALVACSDLAALARAAVSTLPAVPFPTAALCRRQCRICPLADQRAFLLGKARADVEHEGVHVGPISATRNGTRFANRRCSIRGEPWKRSPVLTFSISIILALRDSRVSRATAIRDYSLSNMNSM